MFCDLWADEIHVLWLNTQLPAQRISQPTPAASTTRTHPTANSTRTCTHSSADSHARPANVGAYNPHRLTHPAQDSSVDTSDLFQPTLLILPKTKCSYIILTLSLPGGFPMAVSTVTRWFTFKERKSHCFGRDLHHHYCQVIELESCSNHLQIQQVF